MDPSLPDRRPLDRREALLTRAFDGEATDEELDELAVLASSAEGSPAGDLLALTELRGAVCKAVLAPPIDIADLVMAAIDHDVAWAPLGASVRAAVLAAPSIDIADLVMGSIDPAAELSAYFDGELSAERTSLVAARLLREAAARTQLAAFASVGERLRAATHRSSTGPAVDIWPGVADAIGVERDAVHGWAAIATPLREAFAAIPPIDVAGAVMAAVDPVAVRMPRWASLGGPLLGFAMAAALLFSVLPMSSTLLTGEPNGQSGAIATSAPDLRLATINDALVEEIMAPADVVVQVMQFEAGGPTFIFVDDPPSGAAAGRMGSGVPL